jgi:hypothetical protein
MRNLLALVGLVVVGAAGLGWYLGWYKLDVTRTSDGNLQINTTVDTKKAETDSAAFFKNASSLIGSQIEQTGSGTPPQGTPGGTPGPKDAGTAVNPLAPNTPKDGTAPIKLVAPK